MSAAYKKRRSLPRDFITLIFGNAEMNLSDCIPVHEELERDPGPISRITSHEDIMFQLLTDFDQYATRMARFFSLLNKHSANLSTGGKRRGVGASLADELIGKILVPFLGEDFTQFHLGQPFLDVFSCIIDFCLPYNPRSFETLARNVVECPSLFGALISGKTTGGIMKQLIGTFTTTGFDYQVIRAWTRALIRQCDSCQASHDIERHGNRWHSLEDLLSNLRNALWNYSQQSHDARRRPLDLGTSIRASLGNFGIKAPTSVSGLEMAILRLETGESILVLKAFGESFPCRPCYELSTKPSMNDQDDRGICSRIPKDDRDDSDIWGRILKNGRDDRDIWSRLGFMRFTDLLGERIGMWNVLISAQALEDMQQAHTEGSFELVESTVVRLASGAWERFSIRRTVGGKNSILYLALYGEGETRGILWQLDTEFDEKHDAFMQLIKVWRIGEIQVIVQAVPQIRLIHKTYCQERLEACSDSAIDEETRMNYPLTFSKDFNQCPGTLELGEKAQKMIAQSLLRFNKFYTITKLTFKNIWAQNLTAEYPLSLAREELEIVKDTKASTLIQGRSGTGKTTCLVYKMFGRYLASKTSDPASSPRQVLLTRSHVLSDTLEGYTKRLLATHNAGPNSTGIVNDERSYMFSLDDREIKDTVFTIDSFPLVCTFNYFIKLLENTLRATDQRDSCVRSRHSASGRRAHSSFKSSSLGGLYRRNQVVDFEVFNEQYWPSFPESLKKTISATLAFTEIIGVIKGSAWRLLDFRPLTRQEYHAEGYSLSLIGVNRNQIYDIYEHYERTKRGYGDVDDIDRARNVLQGMSKKPDVRIRIEGAFDEIYVDEVQDQRLLELMMLLHLIKASNAIHFAGDTAQSISKDSVFRFQSVKDLLYSRFSPADNTKPKVCKLSKNYRTHQGILNVATSVMCLLYQNYPSMVDSMKDEEGQFSGPKPAVFVGFDSSIFSDKMFGASSIGTDHVQLGAEQVIIVRDSDQKRELHKKIDGFALILTILESKGMEFEDVLVYDFFTTSTCIPAFRQVQTSYFDADKHFALCSELKQLYVAITRAQKRLWFFESNGANLVSILHMWDQDVDIFRTDNKQAREKLLQLRPGSNANPEIWSARGYQFMEDKNYDTALVCFKRAKDTRGTTLTKALISEKMAKAYLARGNEESSERYFREAVNFFHECNESLREATCYEALGDFKRAGDIFAEHKEFARAADLYTQIKLFEKAANNFALADLYNDGASVLARGNLFDSLVRYLSRYSARLDPAHQRHYSRLCNLLLRRGKISPELKILAASSLRTDAEKEEFFHEYEMTDELFSFLIERRRYLEACSLAIANGDPDKAWDLSELYGTYVGMANLPQKDRIETYNYHQVKLLHSNLASEPTELFVPDPIWDPRCQWLLDIPSIIKFWTDLPRELEDFRRHKINYQSIAFAEPWMEEIFNMIITLKVYVFIVSAESIEQLPVESVNTATRLAKELIIGHNIPVPLLTLLRVLPYRKQTGLFLVLASSLLRTNHSDMTGQQDTAVIVGAIARWAVSSVCQAVGKMQERAKELVYQTEPCITFHYREFCHRPTGPCKFSHHRLVKEEYQAVTNGILRMNSIFCQLLPLFRQKFGGLVVPEEFMKEFRPRQRGWLERLLARLIYISSVEQAPEILMRVRNEIERQNSVHFGLHGALDDLVFHKLKRDKDLDKVCEVSSLLEQLQVAQCLGVRRNFERNLARRVKNHPKAQETWNTLQTITTSLQSGIGRQSVRALDKVMQEVGYLDIQAFHAVISLYEKWATYLVYTSNPGDVVLPNSWVQMYNGLLPGTVLPTDIDSKRHALLSLTRNFCSLVEKVNNAKEFHHKLSGKIRAPYQGMHIFARRNVHFLVTCMLNTCSWRTPPGTDLHLNCTRTRAYVDHVLGLPAANAPEMRGCPSYYILGLSYLASFKIYNGNDCPRIVKATNSGSTFFTLLEPSIPRLCLADWRSAVAEKHTSRDEETPANDDQLLENYAHVEPAVLVIQKMWRSRYPLVLKRRKFFSSPAGQAISYIQRICQVVINTTPMHSTEKLRLRSLLFSDGLNLHLFTEKIDNMYIEFRNQVKKILENADIKQIESAQVKWEILLGMQEKLVESTGFLREGNWHELRTTSKELEERIRAGYNRLQRIEFNLRLLNEREGVPAAVEAIQRVWRSRRHILRHRREFGESEAGQTIAYVHRIVKALNTRDERLGRKGKIRRAAVFFGQVVQLIQEVKRIEKIFQEVNRAVRLGVSASSKEEKEFARTRRAQLAEVRVWVRKNASFLSEANWMQLDVPPCELEARCVEVWRVMRAVEYSLSRIMYPR